MIPHCFVSSVTCIYSQLIVPHLIPNPLLVVYSPVCVCVLVRPPPFPILNPVLYFAVAYAVIKPIVTAPRSVPIEYISTLSKTTVIIVQCDLVRRLETVMVSLVIAKKRRIQTFFYYNVTDSVHKQRKQQRVH